MIEVTLGKNLVVCERPAFPVLNPLLDLSTDLTVARRIAMAAERFFSPSVDVVYSGWARPVGPLDFEPVYYIQLWHRDRVFRTVGMRDLGYVGCLHVELPPDRQASDSFDQDVIGDLCASLKREVAELCVPIVDVDRLEVAVAF